MVYARVLPSGDTTQLPQGAQLPALDITRYLAKPTSTAFSLYDRLPVLTAACSTTKPAWTKPLAVSGALTSASGKPFSGATITLESSLDGKKWTAAASTISGPKGTYAIGYVPPRRTALRVKFKPPATFVSATSDDATVAPMPGVHAPDSIKQAKAGASVTISGKLDARHAAGQHTVTLHLQQLSTAGWTDTPETWAANANSGKTSSRYSRTLTLAPGTWRVMALCKSDALHGQECASWVTFKVK